MPRNDPGGYGGLRPRDVYKELSRQRREAQFWREGGRASRAVIENERWLQDSDLRRVLQDPQLPAERGPRPKEFYRSPQEAEARERINRGGPAGKTVEMRRAKDGTFTAKNPFGRKTRDALKRAIEFARANNQINKMMELIDLLSDIGPGVVPDRYTIVIDGMRMCDGPYGPTADYANTNGFWFALGSLHCAADPADNFQLTGQSFGSGGFIPIRGPNMPWNPGEVAPGAAIPVPGWSSSTNQLVVGYTRTNGAHWIEHSSFVRTAVSGEPDLTFRFRPWMVPQPVVHPLLTRNPNLDRWSPPDLQPIPQAIPATYTSPFANPDLTGLSPRGRREVLSIPASSAFEFTSTRTRSASRRGQPPTRVPVAPREPPGAGKKETKTLSRVARIGIMLYKALDFASEMGDVIDAVYEALPAKVRERRPCPGRGPVDQFGQYGINAADCKLRVLWDNWHQLDTEQAVLNIIKNELEDKIYGAMHRKLPKQAGGPGMERQWEAFGDLMKRLGF